MSIHIHPLTFVLVEHWRGGVVSARAGTPNIAPSVLEDSGASNKNDAPVDVREVDEEDEILLVAAYPRGPQHSDVYPCSKQRKALADQLGWETDDVLDWYCDHDVPLQRQNREALEAARQREALAAQDVDATELQTVSELTELEETLAPSDSASRFFGRTAPSDSASRYPARMVPLRPGVRIVQNLSKRLAQNADL